MSADFPWSTEIRKCLYHIFHYRSFRPKQEEIINSIMSNQDCIAILSTGSGKSLLYQVPTLLSLANLIIISFPDSLPMASPSSFPLSLLSLKTKSLNSNNSTSLQSQLPPVRTPTWPPTNLFTSLLKSFAKVLLSFKN